MVSRGPKKRELDDLIAGAAQYAQSWKASVISLMQRWHSEPAKKPKVGRPNQLPRPNYEDRQWARDLKALKAAPDDRRLNNKFRLRFRMPLEMFEDLVQMCIDRGWFPEQATDCTGRVGPHLRLKVLSVLRVLGRAACFDDCEEGTGIDEETLRTFFHEFTKKFRTELFPVWCRPPEGEEVLCALNDCLALLNVCDVSADRQDNEGIRAVRFARLRWQRRCCARALVALPCCMAQHLPRERGFSDYGLQRGG